MGDTNQPKQSPEHGYVDFYNLKFIQNRKNIKKIQQQQQNLIPVIKFRK